MKRRPQVALLIEASSSYARGVLRGIHSYLREHDPWLIYLLEAEFPRLFNENWKGDGILVHIQSRQMFQSIRRTGLPVVCVGGLKEVGSAPNINADDALVAKLAVDHLLERGFKHFGFYGDNRFSWSVRRKESFAELTSKAGYPCNIWLGAGVNRRDEFYWEQEDEQLSDWIRQLPKPAGVMTCADFHAWRLLEICRRLNVAVPDDVAVIGVDNDELLCDLATPPLSSVRLDTRRIGYEAAKMLDRWMAGKPPRMSVRIPPLEVAARQSTDVLAVSDGEISHAVRFIRDHACEGIKVGNILRCATIAQRA